MRISAPPTTHPCFYGIDTPTRGELIAASKSVEEIAEYVGADSLGYLSVEGLLQAMQRAGGSSEPRTFCTACFTGRYPVPTP
jgi:amidophosphoribosyltransferase